MPGHHISVICSQDDNTEAAVWDAFYNKESAFVVLRSTDGVLFKVPACDLSRRSSFFADMFEIPSIPDKPIDVELSAKLLRLLLDLIRNSGQTAITGIIDRLTINECFNFLEKTIKFDIPDISRIITEHKSFAPDSLHPFWQNVMLATTRPTSVIFRELVRRLNTVSHQTACCWAYFEEMNPAWRIPLLKALSITGKPPADFASWKSSEPGLGTSLFDYQGRLRPSRMDNFELDKGALSTHHQSRGPQAQFTTNKRRGPISEADDGVSFRSKKRSKKS